MSLHCISFDFLKGSRAYKISSERYIDEEIQFLIDVFTENVYERKTLDKITRDCFKECKTHPLLIRILVKISIKHLNFREYPLLDPNQGKRLKRKILRPFLHQPQF